MIHSNLVVDINRCTGCGACKTICPVSAISMLRNKRGISYAFIDKEKCIKCQLCYEVCKEKLLLSENVIKHYQSNNSKSYYGYSKDDKTRYDGASGGVVSEISKYLLNEGVVDAVLMTRQGENSQIFIDFVSDVNEVSNYQGSIYRQVVLLSDYLQEVVKHQFKSVAVVGLPCHISAVKSLHQKTRGLRDVKLLTISLFCKKVKDDRYSNVFRKKMNTRTSIETVCFRGKGWPGTIRTKNKILPYRNALNSLLWSFSTFTPDYCVYCGDSLGLVADVSCGDAWIKKYSKNDQIGSSLCITNSNEGSKIMSAIESLYLEELTFDEVFISQSKQSILKKQSFLMSDQNSISDTVMYKRRRFSEAFLKYEIVFLLPDLLVRILLKVFSRIIR